jgi:hypothetical protein
VQDCDEEFHDAAEAITRDGVPVTDPVLAKMHYEGAKNKRKLLRRQSTISSLNSMLSESISLDSPDVSFNSFELLSMDLCSEYFSSFFQY